MREILQLTKSFANSYIEENNSTLKQLTNNKINVIQSLLLKFDTFKKQIRYYMLLLILYCRALHVIIKKQLSLVVKSKSNTQRRRIECLS